MTLDALSIPGLGGHGLVLLFATAIVFAIFVWDRLPIATVCLGLLFALPLFFLLFPYETAEGPVSPFRFFAGFGHPALVAICSLMILGHGLVVTGALEPLARRLSTLVGRRPRVALALVLVGVAAVSGVINDTPVVVIMIPLILGAVQRAGTSSATLLMPMNFAVLIGGMATTIGTSTNLIVVSMAEDLGAVSLSMFGFYPIVAMAAVPALLYLWLIAPLLLRSVQPPADAYVSPLFEAQLQVEADGWAEGKRLADVDGKTEGRLRVLGVRGAEGQRIDAADHVLRKGDLLLVRDTVENLKEFESILGGSLHGVDQDRGGAADAKDRGETMPDGSEDDSKDAPAASRDPELHEVVAQLVVTPQSMLVGRSVRQIQLATHYNVLAVGVRAARDDRRWHRRDLADRRLGEGDILLIQGRPSAVRDVQGEGLGLLLDSSYVLPRQRKAWIALVTIAAVVALAATKAVPIALAALGGSFVLLLTHCLSWRDIGSSLSAKVIMLVAASLALGQALTLTGGIAYLAQLLVQAAGVVQPWMLLGLLMAIMGGITNFVSNNAAAAIGTPLSIEVARQLGAPVEPFVLAVLFGCNLCYLTPMGYQTNLLVMNAAGYRFRDFLRVGTPLFVLMLGALTLLLIHRYGLWA